MIKFSMDGNMNRDVHETVSQVYYEEELLYAALVELFFQMYTLFLFFFFLVYFMDPQNDSILYEVFTSNLSKY